MKRLLIILLAGLSLTLMSCQYHDPTEDDYKHLQKQWVVDFQGDTYVIDIGVSHKDTCVRAILRADSLYHEKDRYTYTLEMKSTDEGRLKGYGVDDAEMSEVELKFTELTDSSAYITFMFLGIPIQKGDARVAQQLIRIVKDD